VYQRPILSRMGSLFVFNYSGIINDSLCGGGQTARPFQRNHS